MRTKVIVILIVIVIMFNTMGIVSSGPKIILKELPDDQNNCHIRGQTNWEMDCNGHIMLKNIIINPKYAPTLYNQEGVLMHELGHVNGLKSEQDCDNYARSYGYNISNDAYS
jgi:hypothetical protein